MINYIILIFSLICFQLNGQIWNPHFDPFENEYPPLPSKDDKKGIKSELIFEVLSNKDTADIRYFRYDILGRRILVKEKDEDTIYYSFNEYNLVSNVFSQKTDTTYFDYNFDSTGKMLSRIHRFKNNNDTTKIFYDSNNNLIKVIYSPDYFVECSYFKNNQLKSVEYNNKGFLSKLTEYQYAGDTMIIANYLSGNDLEKKVPSDFTYAIKMNMFFEEIHKTNSFFNHFEYITKRYFTEFGQTYYELEEIYKNGVKEEGLTEWKLYYNDKNHRTLLEIYLNKECKIECFYNLTYY